MPNVLNIACPECGGTDSLYLMALDDGPDLYLGPWTRAEDNAAVAQAVKAVISWSTMIVCWDCDYEGACETFKGELPTTLALRKKLVSNAACILAKFMEANHRPPSNGQAQGTIKVTRQSLLTGRTTTLDLPVTQQQLDAYISGCAHLQDAFPDLAPQLREFIKSGITPEEWQQYVIGKRDKPDDKTA